jgi:peptidylprolyl isomerase
MAVKNGDNVKVHYTGKLKDGSVFDSSRDREPLAFQLGSGQLIPGFEKAVVGMEVGDSTTVEIEPKDAYGDRNPDMLIEISKQQVPPDLDPQVGQALQVQQGNGQVANVVVHELKPESIVLDANHPLAGKDLVFDIELVSAG